MKVLLFGATGATGRLVVEQLISKNVEVKIVVRGVTDDLKEMVVNGRLECIVGSVSEFESNDFMNLIEDCDAVISCLGHNISLKGIYGKPRTLVTKFISDVCDAIIMSKNKKIKMILMNTTANSNYKMKEKYSLKDRIVLSLLWLILPPHKDNVEAARYLSEKIKEGNELIEWVAVRPDSLIDAKEVTDYEVSESPKRSPVFDAGKTSRINVAHFMSDLLLKETLWSIWKFKMPVIYNNDK